jgi:hypothetical protein
MMDTPVTELEVEVVGAGEIVGDDGAWREEQSEDEQANCIHGEDSRQMLRGL